MPSPDFTVAFHIGAHKTATTHLQRSLSKAADELHAVGVRYYGPPLFRLPGRSIPALFGLKQDDPDQVVRRTPSEQLELMRKSAERLVFSEENYVGVLNGPRRLPLKVRYPDAGPRLAALANALGRKVDVLIGIRRPTGFLNSAYCQMLLGGRVMPMADFKHINPIESVDWLDMLTRLRAADGVGDLTVWRHEDYAALFPQICASLVGPAHAHHVQFLDRRIHTGLSADAVGEIAQRHDDGDAGKLGFGMRKLLPVGPDYPAFDGFDEIEHAIGEAAYAKQIAAIAQLAGVTSLQPDQF